MSDCPAILAIDDEPRMLEILARQLEPEFLVHTVSSGPEGLAKLDAIAPALILLDLRMPQMNGTTFLRRLREADKHIPVIILTAYGSVASAVQAISLGAVDYIEKPFESRRLQQAVRASLARRKSVWELSSRQSIIGESPQIRKVWQLVEKYGPTDLPILLYGETGTGKELFARSFHEIDKRRRGPFVPVDVSAVPESLMESEIFGYEKGAFTGANGRKPGQLEWANGGVLFLDEIGNLSLSCQVKLLRVLQEVRYVPLGGREAKALDVRLVSASNIDLREAIQRGTFREDLYYRINGVTIELPPLREREGDIELLARHFVEMYSRRYNKPSIEISGKAMELLLSYQWPGNVRELKHAMARAVVLADRVALPQHLSLPRSAEVSTPKLDRTAHERLGASHLSSDGGDAKEIVIELSFRCDLAGTVDLKKIKEKVASEAERLVIAETKKRFSLTQTGLAKFFDVDPKTLRSKIKRGALLESEHIMGPCGNLQISGASQR